MAAGINGMPLGAMSGAVSKYISNATHTGAAQQVGKDAAQIQDTATTQSLPPKQEAQSLPGLRVSSREDGSQVGLMTLLSKGLALNVVNPKGYIFMLAVIPQFIDYDMPLRDQYVAIALTFAFTDLVVMACYTGLAAKALTYLKTEAQMRMLNKVFGGLFMVGATVLATFHQAH